MRGDIGQQVRPHIRPEGLSGEPEVISGNGVKGKRSQWRVAVTGSDQVHAGRVADGMAVIRREENIVQALKVRFRFAGAQQEAGELRLRQEMPVGEDSFQQKGQAEVLRVRQADVHAAIAALMKIQLAEPVFLLTAPVGVVVGEAHFIIVVGLHPQRFNGHAEGLDAVVVDELAAQRLQNVYLLVISGSFQIADQSPQAGSAVHTLIPFRNVLKSIPCGCGAYKLWGKTT